MKLRFHKSDVYTMEMLLSKLNEQPNVTVLEAMEDTFLDYRKMLDVFYKQFNSGTVQKNHMLWVTSAKATTIISKEYKDATQTVAKDFLKNSKDGVGSQKQQLDAYVLIILKPPGLKEIKMAELYSKWQPYVPEPYRDLICLKPPDDILERLVASKRKWQKQRGCAMHA